MLWVDLVGAFELDVFGGMWIEWSGLSGIGRLKCDIALTGQPYRCWSFIRAFERLVNLRRIYWSTSHLAD